MRLFGLVFASLVLFGATVAPSALADPASDARASAVIVSSRIAEHRDAIGAGVIVAIEPHGVRIVTARHVADAGEVTVWIDRKPYPAEIARTFAHRDLAVVDAIVPEQRSLGLRPAAVGAKPTAGSALYVWGEDDAGPRLEPATVLTPHSPYGDPSGVALLGFACAGCRQGDSGAGVFSSDGRLLGVLTARMHTRDDRTIMLVAEPIDASVYASDPTVTALADTMTGTR